MPLSFRAATPIVPLAALLVVFGCNDEPAATAGAAPTAATPPAVASPAAGALDAANLGQRLGVALQTLADGALHAELPRDLDVMVDGTALPEALVLGTSVTFRPAAAGAEVSGRVVLLEDEIGAALDALLAHGIAVTALHNRFAFDEPSVSSLHFAAEGKPGLLASGVQAVGAAVRDVRLSSPEPRRALVGAAPVQGSLDAKAIGGVLGVEARSVGDAVRLEIARPSAAAGSPPGPLLEAVFMGSDASAAVEGSAHLRPSELAGVLGGLRRGNLHVAAVTPIVRGSRPVHFEVHFRGRGSSLHLVRTLHAATLEARKPPPSATAAK